ncbi:MAG TPA: addiction module protein [Acidobacteria bacterium]|nr:addiction module protein [Acidobacteriota bacterium]
MDTKQLIAEVVALPEEERLSVIDSLLRSLTQPESEVDREWAALAERRLAELRSGAVRAVPGKEVFDRISRRFDT